MSAVIRRPMASALSPPGARPQPGHVGADEASSRSAPVLTVSGTAMLSMRLASTSWASMSAKVAVLSTAWLRQPVEVHLEAVHQGIARHEREAAMITESTV